jgi:hypothetical protein
MANTSDTAGCFTPTETKEQGLLTLSPFYSLNYHFGMLLGAEDFDTQQAYHRGKMRLHNAWLHGAGVIWGFDVRLDAARGEIRVLPGLALDAAGHELHLEGDACLNVAAWLEANRNDPRLELKTNAALATEQFDGYVSVRFRGCLTRPVPAMAEPCAGGALNTAFSRVMETITLKLEPGPAPQRSRHYHRLRLLFGLDQPVRDKQGVVVAADQEVIDARDAILARPYTEQPAACEDAFDRFAALDEIALQPFSDPSQGGPQLFPAKEDEPVVLAVVGGLTLQTQGTAKTVTAGTVDCTVRPTLVDAATIQELLPGPSCRQLRQVVAGPRVQPGTVKLAGKSMSFRVNQPLEAGSVVAGAFAVSEWVGKWRAMQVAGAVYEPGDQTVTVRLHDAVKHGVLVRIIARGTGATPLLGANLVPLAGGSGDPPASEHDGSDFVFMIKGGSDV